MAWIVQQITRLDQTRNVVMKQIFSNVWQAIKGFAGSIVGLIGKIVKPVLAAIWKLVQFLFGLIPWRWLGTVLAPVGRFLWAIVYNRFTIPVWKKIGSWLAPIFPWSYLYQVGKPFWVSEHRGKALALFGGILALMFGNLFMQYLLSKAPGAFNNAVLAKSEHDFIWAMLMWVGAILAMTPVNVFYGMLRTQLGIEWRQWLSTSVYEAYYAHRAYLKLKGRAEIDNPDQRMSQDIDSFCNNVVGIFMAFLDAAVNICLFTGVLFYLSAWLPPGAVVAAAVGSGIVFYLGRKLPALNFQLMKTEADLRGALRSSSTYAEALALYRGEKIAQKQAVQGIGHVRDTLYSIMYLYMRWSLFSTFYNAFVPLVPTAIMAYMYIHGTVTDFGKVAQAGPSFMNVYNGLSVLVGQFGALATLRAVANRLGPLFEALKEAGVDKFPEGKFIKVTEGPDFLFKKTTVRTNYLSENGSEDSFGRVAVVDLDLEVPKGMWLMITGPNGAGKGAVAKAMAGTNNAGSGDMQRPPSNQVMYLNQDPYLPKCTLRDYLLSECTDNPTDDHMTQVMIAVGLQGTPERPGLVDKLSKLGGFDTEQDWKEVLTIVEQQRLGLARIMLARPEYVIVDQATSALEQENVDLFYALLRGFGSTVISTAVDAKLAEKHTKVLELKGDNKGSWEVFDAGKYNKPSWKNLLGM
jgi:putative ATP-binding cassette transporter